MIFLVQLEVLGQLANAFAENRNLHFRATRISVMGAKARNNFGLLCSCQHGSALLLYVKSSPLSKCLTKNNMALKLRPWTKPASEGIKAAVLIEGNDGGYSIMTWPPPPGWFRSSRN